MLPGSRVCSEHVLWGQWANSIHKFPTQGIITSRNSLTRPRTFNAKSLSQLHSRLPIVYIMEYRQSSTRGNFRGTFSYEKWNYYFVWNCVFLKCVRCRSKCVMWYPYNINCSGMRRSATRATFKNIDCRESLFQSSLPQNWKNMWPMRRLWSII